MLKILDRFGIDTAVIFTLFNRSWSILAGVVTLFFIAQFMSIDMQGYYYTFNSLLALQVFAELGLNYAIVQFASHEMAHLSWNDSGIVSGRDLSKKRLQSLIRFSFFWFGVASVVLVCFLIPAGLLFFDADTSLLFNQSSVTLPWVLLVFFTSFNLFVGMCAAILEGCGKVAAVALMRFWQVFVGSILVWVVLYFNGNLFALAVNAFAVSLIGAGWIGYRYRRFFFDILCFKSSEPGMNWTEEIWPFQWRIAVSWLSGFFIFQIFNPILFRTVGPAAAGQMGMSMQVFTAINGAALVWISTKIPTYGRLIALNRRQELDALFFRNLIVSLVFLLFSIATMFGLVYFLDNYYVEYANRILPLELLVFLAVGSILNHFVFAAAAYLRAHKEEPFMMLSIYSGVLTVGLTATLIPLYGLSGAVFSYVIPIAVVGFLGGGFVFFKKRKLYVLSVR